MCMCFLVLDLLWWSLNHIACCARCGLDPNVQKRLSFFARGRLVLGRIRTKTFPPKSNGGYRFSNAAFAIGLVCRLKSSDLVWPALIARTWSGNCISNTISFLNSASYCIRAKSSRFRVYSSKVNNYSTDQSRIGNGTERITGFFFCPFRNAAEKWYGFGGNGDSLACPRERV